jgi:hypothetical protein
MPRFVLWGTLLVLLTYGKILWPLVIGHMRTEGTSFFEAVQHFPLHAAAFCGLVFAGFAGYMFAKAKWSRPEQ